MRQRKMRNVETRPYCARGHWLLYEPDSQRVLIMLPVVGLDRSNNEEHDIEHRNGRQQEKADNHKTKKYGC
jgi:hypothetical protein